jgi:hypothetical protein
MPTTRAIARSALCCVLTLALAPACDDEEEAAPFRALIPGPDEEGYDSELALKAERYDRQFAIFSSMPTGANADLSIPLSNEQDRALIESFLRQESSWDFETSTGKPVEEVIDHWQKVAGAYAGPGAAADAFRYGLLRDQGDPQQEVDRAREQLLAAARAMHRAVEITGVPGVIARGYQRTDYASGWDNKTVPLFDGNGAPLPEPKNNGTWREDNSGKHPNFIWEDSCSRDMYVGWAIGFAAVWEVIQDDETIARELKDQLKGDARALALELGKVRESGFDLEIPDADGRITFHGYLHEKNFDRIYTTLPRNGQHAVMALGSAAAWAYITQDPEVNDYLYKTLLEKRQLAKVAKDWIKVVHVWPLTNFSNYNMAFQGAWLALRYIDPEKAPIAYQDLMAAAESLYSTPGMTHQPKEQKQSFYDLVYAVGKAGASVWRAPGQPTDEGALERGLETLGEFPDPPYWERSLINCDDQEIAAKVCTGQDGTRFDILGNVGRNNKLVADQPVPMRIRPPSNYHWRSNPYAVNSSSADDSPRLLPGVDFRFAYWLGRWVRRQ